MILKITGIIRFWRSLGKTIRLDFNAQFRISFQEMFGSILSVIQESEWLIKVAWVVNIKLGFTDELFGNLIMLIQWCKTQYLNLCKLLLFPRNQVICLKNLKLCRAPTTIEFNIFCSNFYTRFRFTNVYKTVCGIFFILFKS